MESAHPRSELSRLGDSFRVEKLFSLRRVAGVTVGVMGAAFAVVAALIIGTALKIAVFARRDVTQEVIYLPSRAGLIAPYKLKNP